ncbi:Crp/Fnr family transcriptional regulator [uncultured Ilyobacter sp.]|uniref:Crp/Fnr family transcriptional regulator n=1 Tax=uncultured Ilyobacter sp. TaxID=544433 RepID=UPI0029F46472|nr:Crp/Fnr family transcriptional regulator [uncultured Ilyobacter sp.]
MAIFLRKILKDIPMFNTLNDSQIEYLIKNSKLREVNKNQVMHNLGDRCENLSMIIKGTICGIKYSSTGKEQVLAYYEAPECFGGVLIFDDEKYPANLIAQENSTVLEISKKIVFQLFQNKEFLTFFLKDMSKKIISLSDIIEVLIQPTVKSRVAKYILKEMEKQGGTVIKIEKSKTFIAKELGSVREVISRIFKNFEKQKIIKKISFDKVEILNIPALEKEFMK